MKRKKAQASIFIALLIALIFFSACKKDNGDNQNDNMPQGSISLEINPESPYVGFLNGDAMPKAEIIIRNMKNSGLVIDKLEIEINYNNNSILAKSYSDNNLYDLLIEDGYGLQILSYESMSNGEKTKLYYSIPTENTNFTYSKPFSPTNYPGIDKIKWQQNKIIPTKAIFIIIFPIEILENCNEINDITVSVEGKLIINNENIRLTKTIQPMNYNSTNCYNLPVNGEWKIIEGRGGNVFAAHHRRGIYSFFNQNVIIPTGRQWSLDFSKEDETGNDITSGQPIYSIFGGVVIEIDHSDAPQKSVRIINTETGDYINYAHLGANTVSLNVGDTVFEGQHLGNLYDWAEYDHHFPHLHIDITYPNNYFEFGPKANSKPILFKNICIRKSKTETWQYIESGVLESGYYFKKADGENCQTCLE